MTAVNPDGLHIAIIGTQGVPARYGGPETATGETGRCLIGRGHQVPTYCRSPEPSTPLLNTCLRTRSVELPSTKNHSLETLLYMALSVAHLLRHTHPDAAFVFDTASPPFLSALRTARTPVATHVGGLEWRRGKRGPTGERYYRAAEALTVRYSDVFIVDVQGVADYYTEGFDAPTDLLAHGAPRISVDTSRLAELDLSPRGFHLVVTRFEVENRVDVIVEGYVRPGATFPLVVVGSTPYTDDYTTRIESLTDSRVRLLGGLWDQSLLGVLYSDALVYFHGHSVGGMNPSLLCATGARAAMDASDAPFSRKVLDEVSRYQTTPDEVATLVVSAESDIEAQGTRDEESCKRTALYDWDEMASGYEALARRLTLEGPVRRHPPGHHTGKASW